MQRERDAMGGGPLYSDMSTWRRWAAREEADKSKAARTEWARERQALRGEEIAWMKTMTPEQQDAFDALDPDAADAVRQLVQDTA